MNRFMSMKYAVVLFPALSMGASVASAEEYKCDCPCDSERASVSAEKSHGKQGSEQAAKAEAHSRLERESRVDAEAAAAAKASAKARAIEVNKHYLTSKPEDGYFSGNIVGHEVMNRRDNKVVGKVDELLIDENGQIGAVIISTGGIMGLGQKELAIAWDQVERKVDGEGITLSIDVSDLSLVEAPAFARK